MPWTKDNGPSRHTKAANTDKRKRQWSAVANNILERTGDEGRAVRGANGVIKKRGKKRKVTSKRRKSTRL